MKSNSSKMNFYCSNIGDEERDEEPAGAGFFHFGSVFVEIQSSVGAALRLSYAPSSLFSITMALFADKHYLVTLIRKP